ncbi:DUF2231 domain-containing protein [Bradyrhizobium sp.]|uniref:DUF2231 domain-containing protein n=1 Tax=Bradyrhizobium sp. TaxID=376 RepID=UPI0039E666EC
MASLVPAGPKTLLHPIFIGAGATLLITASVGDIMYWETSNWQWANMSSWLIVGGLIMALLATIVLIIDFLTGRAARINWLSFLLVAAAASLSLLNIFIHSRDAWTSVVPQGITISAIVTILLLMAAFNGWKVTTVRMPAAGDRP